MRFLGILLGKLFEISYGICGHNYLLCMLVFTFFTKVIMLPVSIWNQMNGLKTLKIQPELNMIKVNYFGDKDKIDDETQALYKREKYNAFVGVVPLLFQIVILLGIIDVVKMPELAGMTQADMRVGNILFYEYPNVLGGLYWFLPLLAGLSATALSLFQNRKNPVQANQGGSSKYGTMAVSVGISLFLGAFVQVAVGTYWIVSNLLTIPQQIALNALTKPERIIDYEKLEESKAKLQEIQNLGRDVDKAKKREYARKERKDYKRFFSVVNKHLVFYSEKNGFYKYFQNTIEYLLENSNVTIHYITSDPEDKIFELEKQNNRIKGYYIGEKRLITLFMKMDADMVVMTMSDLENYHYKRSYVRKDIEYVYMFHYPLSTHMVLHTGALDHYDTILCVGQFQIPEIRQQEKLYNLPEKRLEVCGYGQLELLAGQYEAMPPKTDDRPKILIAPSWQTDNILDLCIDDVLAQVLGKGYNVVVRPHPEYVKRYKARMNAVVERYRDYEGGDLTFELDFTDNSSLFNSDICISDWSGAAYEFSFVTGKPALFVDTPMKVNNPDYEKLGVEPLEITLRDQVGERVAVDKLDTLDETIRRFLKHQDDYIKNNEKIRDTYIANFGSSGAVSGEYILTTLRRRISERKQAE